MALTKEGGDKLWAARFPEWEAACHRRHGGKYAYSSERVLCGDVWKVRIVCPDHGEFLQAPAKHKLGQGCPVCAGNVSLVTRDKLIEMFPGQEFPVEIPATSKARFKLMCREHGEFVTSLNKLLTTKAKLGVACSKCNMISRGARRRNTDTLFRLKDRWPGYQFDLVSAPRVTDVIGYVCPAHGRSESKIADLLNGHGCPECGRESRQSSIRNVVGVTVQQNLEDIARVHGGKLIVHKSTINLTKDKVKVSCVKHGSYWVNLYALKAGVGCAKCTHRVSKGETELVSWLQSLGIGDVTTQRRDVLERGELDIVIEDHDLAIEYCGLYWHGENFKSKDYHQLKERDAGKAGLKLITVFEDEWVFKQDIVKRVLLNKLGLLKDKVLARNTVARKATWHDVVDIYEKFHMQGAGAPCAENYVLEHNGVIVAAMSFKPDRFGGYDKELVRYATSTQVVGGFSKLFKLFSKNNAAGTDVVSYADLRWFSGVTYRSAGFKFVSQTAPGYWWCKGQNRFSRFMFQKHKLAALLPKFDPDLSESENMIANGYWKISDCGMAKWALTL